MIRIVRGLLKIRPVAANTVRGDADILFVHMAGLATHRNVLPAEGKLRPVVIEQAVRPERRVVTGLASGGESRRRVVRALRCTELRHVATSAILRRAFELVAYVALHATRLHVASGEGIARCRIVIELRAFPYRCGMAHRTVFRKTRRDVIRVVRWLAARFPPDVPSRAR